MISYEDLEERSEERSMAWIIFLVLKIKKTYFYKILTNLK
jgi:hypothetical protein